jgi:hypothetical protein
VLGGRGTEQLGHAGGARLVEARGGLVEQQQAAAGRERTGERDTLALATGEATDRLAGPLGDAEGGEPGLRLGSRLLERREVRGEGEPLADDGDPVGAERGPGVTVERSRRSWAGARRARRSAG